MCSGENHFNLTYSDGASINPLESQFTKLKALHQFYVEMLSSSYLRWSKRQWECVLLSDESMFQLVLGKNRHGVHGPKNERDNPEFHK